MPIFDLEPSQFPVRAQTGAAELVDPAILQDKQMAETLKNEKAFQLLGAAFRESNAIGSALGRQTLGVDNQPEDGFNAWNDIAGTKYEPHWKSFVSANNQRYADSIKRQIDMEEQDRRLVAAAGWRGTLASFAAGTLDLPILIPGGGLVRSVKGGYSMGASALGIGAAAGVGVGVQEAALHASQETRTGQESAINIGAGVVLGSMLGAGAAGLLSRAERKVATKALTKIESGEGAPSTDLVGALGAPEGAVGADTVQKLAIRDLSVDGAVADAWARTTKNVNPNLRSNYRPVAAAREYMQQLAENTVYQVAHNEGRTVGPSVETTSRVAFVSRMGEAVTAHDAAYEAMSKAGINMTHGDFEDAVGRAMRNGDADVNPHVQQAAQMWRAKVFEPFKKEAIELGLLPADVPVKTAASYFSRVYNKVKLIAQEGPFKNIVAEHYSGVLSDEYSQSVQAMQKRKARLGQEAADLQMSPASRMSTMKSLEEQGARLDQANAEHVARLADISDLRQKVKEARLAGDNVASQMAEQEIARIKEEGGAGLKAYQEQRSVLRQRMRNVDLGYAGIASRTDQIVQSLVNIEETNHRQLSRLVDKGRRFEREAQRLDPEKYEARKSELITSFNQVAQRADRAADRTKAAIERMRTEAEALPPDHTPDTRGLGQQYHGSSNDKLELDDHFYTPLNYYGQGFYTTDAADVAQGYARKGSKRTGKQVVYSVKESRPLNIYDAEAPLGGEVLKHLEEEAKGKYSISDAIGVALDTKPKNLREFYDAMREEGTALGMSADDIQEGFSALNDTLRNLGYDGLRHLGGLRTKTAPHNVTIYFNPTKDVTIAPTAPAYGPRGRAAEMTAKLEQHEQTQRAHAARLQRIADRLDRLENFDPEAALAEVRAGVDAAVEQISHSSLMRGEKSQRLKDRLERLDPKAVERRLKEIDATKREIDMNFYDRWGRVEGAGTKSPNFDLMARDIANDVHDALTGRKHRDDSAMSHPEFFTPITRGPMKDRTFNIPDHMIEDFLESNVREVGERYARTMAGEVELTRRFGRADMRDQLTEIGHQYRDLRDAVQAAKTPEEIKGLVGRSPGFAEGLKGKLAGQDELTRSREAALSFLDKDELSARNDLTSVRDLVRGMYKVDANSGNYARVVRSVMAYNYIRHMGNFIAANWSELYRPAMVHGLGRYMSEGIAPLVKNLMRGFEGEAAASIKEAKLAGLVSERVLHARMAAFGEVADPYAKGSAFERLLFNGTKIATKWNGLAAFTDFEHSLSAIVTQNRILEAATGKAPDVRYLAYLGIDENMAKRIGAHFEKHGEVLDGNVHVANTERWGDDVAVRTYRAAVNKDVNTIIPHKGLGDIPLFCNTPTGRMMLQFRAFNMAANQRVTLRGLQESQARFVSGLVGATTMGMAAAYFTALRGGKDSYERFVKEASANPGFLVGEGLDKAGIFTLPFEAASSVQAMAGGAGFRDFNPIKSPIAAAWPGGSAPVEDRYGSSDPLSRLLGPSASIPYTLSKAMGFGIKTATGGEGSKQQKKAAAMLAPYSSYYGFREVLQLLTGDSPYR